MEDEEENGEIFVVNSRGNNFQIQARITVISVLVAGTIARRVAAGRRRWNRDLNVSSFSIRRTRRAPDGCIVVAKLISLTASPYTTTVAH